MQRRKIAVILACSALVLGFLTFSAFRFGKKPTAPVSSLPPTVFDTEMKLGPSSIIFNYPSQGFFGQGKPLLEESTSFVMLQAAGVPHGASSLHQRTASAFGRAGVSFEANMSLVAYPKSEGVDALEDFISKILRQHYPLDQIRTGVMKRADTGQNYFLMKDGGSWLAYTKVGDEFLSVAFGATSSDPSFQENIDSSSEHVLQQFMNTLKLNIKQ